MTVGLRRGTPIGFVGLGSMGAPMARRVAQAGYRLVAYDREHGARDRIRPHADGLAQSLTELGNAVSVVVLMLPDGTAVRSAVLDEPDCLLAALTPGSVVVDMGSSDPAGTIALGEALEDREVMLVDAPVSGGVPKAETGELAVLCGGPAAVVKGLDPLLAVFGRHRFHAGPLGSGHALKALNNLLSACGLLAATETLLIGQRYGLDLDVMLDVLNASTGRNNSTERKFQPYVFTGRFDAGFRLALMQKDVETAIRLARSTGTAAPLSTVCAELWRQAAALLPEDADHTEIVRLLEQRSGAQLRTGEGT
jgi:3-hydroxyisobutyrate dehydrogenase